MEFYKQLGILESAFHILDFTIALIVLMSKTKSHRYLYRFFVYNIVSLAFVVIAFLALYISAIPLKIFFTIYNLSLLFHFCFLGIFIISFTQGILFKKVQIMLLMLCFTICVVCLLNKELIYPNRLAFGITNFFLVIFCVCYFTSLFWAKSSSQNLLKEPIFWIINGVFFGMIIGIPSHLATNYFPKESSSAIWSVLITFGSLAYIVMHVFFIKAYASVIRPNKIL